MEHLVSQACDNSVDVTTIRDKTATKTKRAATPWQPIVRVKRLRVEEIEENLPLHTLKLRMRTKWRAGICSLPLTDLNQDIDDENLPISKLKQLVHKTFERHIEINTSLLAANLVASTPSQSNDLGQYEKSVSQAKDHSEVIRNLTQITNPSQVASSSSQVTDPNHVASGPSQGADHSQAEIQPIPTENNLSTLTANLSEIAIEMEENLPLSKLVRLERVKRRLKPCSASSKAECHSPPDVAPYQSKIRSSTPFNDRPTPYKSEGRFAVPTTTFPPPKEIKPRAPRAPRARKPRVRPRNDTVKDTLSVITEPQPRKKRGRPRKIQLLKANDSVEPPISVVIEPTGDISLNLCSWQFTIPSPVVEKPRSPSPFCSFTGDPLDTADMPNLEEPVYKVESTGNKVNLEVLVAQVYYIRPGLTTRRDALMGKLKKQIVLSEPTVSLERLSETNTDMEHLVSQACDNSADVTTIREKTAPKTKRASAPWQPIVRVKRLRVEEIEENLPLHTLKLRMRTNWQAGIRPLPLTDLNQDIDDENLPINKLKLLVHKTFERHIEINTSPLTANLVASTPSQSNDLGQYEKSASQAKDHSEVIRNLTQITNPSQVASSSSQVTGASQVASSSSQATDPNHVASGPSQGADHSQAEIQPIPTENNLSTLTANLSEIAIEMEENLPLSKLVRLERAKRRLKPCSASSKAECHSPPDVAPYQSKSRSSTPFNERPTPYKSEGRFAVPTTTFPPPKPTPKEIKPRAPRAPRARKPRVRPRNDTVKDTLSVITEPQPRKKRGRPRKIPLLKANESVQPPISQAEIQPIPTEINLSTLTADLSEIAIEMEENLPLSKLVRLERAKRRLKPCSASSKTECHSPPDVAPYQSKIRSSTPFNDRPTPYKSEGRFAVPTTTFPTPKPSPKEIKPRAPRAPRARKPRVRPRNDTVKDTLSVITEPQPRNKRGRPRKIPLLKANESVQPPISQAEIQPIPTEINLSTLTADLSEIAIEMEENLPLSKLVRLERAKRRFIPCSAPSKAECHAPPDVAPSQCESRSSTPCNERPTPYKSEGHCTVPTRKGPIWRNPRRRQYNVDEVTACFHRAMLDMSKTENELPCVENEVAEQTSPVKCRTRLLQGIHPPPKPPPKETKPRAPRVSRPQKPRVRPRNVSVIIEQQPRKKGGRPRKVPLLTANESVEPPISVVIEPTGEISLNLDLSSWQFTIPSPVVEKPRSPSPFCGFTGDPLDTADMPNLEEPVYKVGSTVNKVNLEVLVVQVYYIRRGLTTRRDQLMGKLRSQIVISEPTVSLERLSATSHHNIVSTSQVAEPTSLEKLSSQPKPAEASSQRNISIKKEVNILMEDLALSTSDSEEDEEVWMAELRRSIRQEPISDPEDVGAGCDADTVFLATIQQSDAICIRDSRDGDSAETLGRVDPIDRTLNGPNFTLKPNEATCGSALQPYRAQRGGSPSQEFFGIEDSENQTLNSFDMSPSNFLNQLYSASYSLHPTGDYPGFTGQRLEAHSQNTFSSSQQQRFITDIPSQPQISTTDIPSEPQRSTAAIPVQPQHSYGAIPSQPQPSIAAFPSQLQRFTKTIPSLPWRCNAAFPSQPQPSIAAIPSQPQRSIANIPSQPQRLDELLSTKPSNFSSSDIM